MARGTVKDYKEDGGFGFIRCPDQKGDLFFHIRDCLKGWTPRPEDECEFSIGQGKKGPVAQNVQPLRPMQDAYPNRLAALRHANGRNGAPDAKPIQKTPQQTGASVKPPNPYRFADIDLKLALADEPVWHDGAGAKDRHTGKLFINLRALTPLLAGWAQYAISQAKPGIRTAAVAGVPMDNRDPDAKMQDKKILEPFRLEDGRIVIAGRSLNGLVRHSLGALLSAPMERVAEKVYSYRPALKADSKPSDRLRLLPAVIDGWENGGGVRVKVLPGLECAHFSQGSIERRCKELEEKCQLGKSVAWQGAEAYDMGYKKYFCEKPGKTLSNYHIFSYVGGIDACGELNEAFKKNSAGLHGYVAVSSFCMNGAISKVIDPVCIQHYIASLEQLRDTETGHLRPGHPLLGKGKNVDVDTIRRSLGEQIALWENRSFALKNRLIYVEVESRTGSIRSLGHNFQYRWRYVDSVRIRDGQVRKILKPLDAEVTPPTQQGHAKPKRLSAARLFCGYVSRREKDVPWREQGSDNIGEGDYSRLKGRIGCGFAVERIVPEKPTEQDRFLQGADNNLFLVPLKPLGMPRPSAVEHYLRQPLAADVAKKRGGDAGKLLTYGDLPALPGGAADKPAELAGRKFYLHQPDAAGDRSVYEDRDKGTVKSDQAALGRYISRSDAEFRFALDFQDLRPWELGALLVALFPSQHLPAVAAKLAEGDPAFAALKAKLDKLDTIALAKGQPAMAHKLGHGRPLGLGSVLLRLDRAEVLAEENGLPAPAALESKTIADCLSAFVEKLKALERPEALARHLERWAAVHRYAGLRRAAYRTGGDRNGKATIFNFHTGIRKAHAENRRKLEGDAGAKYYDILPEASLDDLG